MKNIFSFNFWFNLRPDALSASSLRIIMILLLLLLFLAIIFRIFRTKKRGVYSALYRRLTTYFFTNFAVAAVLLFFGYEMIPILSARFFWLLWAILSVVWLLVILLKMKEVPQKKEELEQAKEFRKYLP